MLSPRTTHKPPSRPGQAAGLVYDAAGNVTFDGNNSYAYDGDGRICAMATHPPSGGTLAFQYIYDADGNRVAKGTLPSLTCDPTQLQITAAYFIGPDGETMTEIDGNGSWVGTEVFTVAANSSVSQYIANPFGDGFTTSSGPDADPYHFAGLDGDADGTMHAQFRNYHPTYGRWLSPDPYIGSYRVKDPQSFNRYVYARNNPLAARDPSGLEEDDCVEYSGDAYQDCLDETTGSDGGANSGLPSATDSVSVSANSNNDSVDVTSSEDYSDDGLYDDGLDEGETGPQQQQNNAPNKPCPAVPAKIISASATTNAPTEYIGAAIGALVGGEPGAFVGGIVGSLFGVGGNVSYVPSTKSWYAGPIAVFAPGVGGGNGVSLNYVNVPSGQNANSIANGQSYSITFQPRPLFGSIVTKSPGSGPPVVGPSVGTRVPVSFGAGYNFCLHNCGC